MAAEPALLSDKEYRRASRWSSRRWTRSWPSSALIHRSAVVAGTWVEVDVTPAVTGNGSFAFGIGKSDTSSAYYGSRESAHPPQLVIETTP